MKKKTKINLGAILVRHPLASFAVLCSFTLTPLLVLTTYGYVSTIDFTNIYFWLLNIIVDAPLLFFVIVQMNYGAEKGSDFHLIEFQMDAIQMWKNSKFATYEEKRRTIAIIKRQISDIRRNRRKNWSGSTRELMRLNLRFGKRVSEKTSQS